ncbi:MAG: hypothetical protein ACRC11_19770 [Xenococcaceae cyanobacterium]
MLSEKKLKEYALAEEGDRLRSMVATFYLARYEGRAEECFPDAQTAFKFAFTELAEVVDAELRLEANWDRNNAKNINIIGEIYDTILMLVVAAISALPDREPDKIFLDLEKALDYSPNSEPDPPVELLSAFHLTIFGNIKLNMTMLEVEEDATYNHPLRAYQRIENFATCVLEFIRHLLSQIDWIQECEGHAVDIELKGKYIEQFQQHLDRKLAIKNKKNLATTLQELKEKCLQN